MITLDSFLIVKERAPFVDLTNEIFGATAIDEGLHTFRILRLALASIEAITSVRIAINVEHARSWADASLQEPGPQHGNDMRVGMVMIAVVPTVKVHSRED